LCLLEELLKKIKHLLSCINAIERYQVDQEIHSEIGPGREVGVDVGFELVQKEVRDRGGAVDLSQGRNDCGIDDHRAQVLQDLNRRLRHPIDVLVDSEKLANDADSCAPQPACIEELPVVV